MAEPPFPALGCAPWSKETQGLLQTTLKVTKPFLGVSHRGHLRKELHYPTHSKFLSPQIAPLLQLFTSLVLPACGGLSPTPPTSHSAHVVSMLHKTKSWGQRRAQGSGEERLILFQNCIVPVACEF